MIEGNAYFMKYAYQGNLYKTLVKNIAIDFKLKAQYADGTIVPSGSKMQIGGVNTVRGYREGMLSANSGVNAMTELQYDCSKKRLTIMPPPMLQPLSHGDQSSDKEARKQSHKMLSKQL